jgi:hypothetical protein
MGMLATKPPSPGPGYVWNGSAWVLGDQNQPVTNTTSGSSTSGQPTTDQGPPLPSSPVTYPAQSSYPSIPADQSGFTQTSPPLNGAPPPGDTNGMSVQSFHPGEAPSGYDPSKWNNPDYWSHPKYRAGEVYLDAIRRGLSVDDAIKAVVAQFPGAVWNGGDVVDFGTQGGEYIGQVDIVRDYGGENGVNWQPLGQDGGTGQGSGSPVGMPAGGPWTEPGGYAGGGGNASVPAAQNSPLNDIYRQAILSLLQTPQTVDAKSLSESPEATAYDYAAQRGEERQRAQLAEQSAADGTSNSGGFDTQVQGLRQQRAEGESQFLGQLAVTKMQQNREALVQGIQFAMSDGQFDKAQALQVELANLDAAIRREQIASSASTAANALAVQQQLGLLGIGFDYDQLAANMNRDATLAMLQ